MTRLPDFQDDIPSNKRDDYGYLEELETIELGKQIFPEEQRITENDLRASENDLRLAAGNDDLLELRDAHNQGDISYP